MKQIKKQTKLEVCLVPVRQSYHPGPCISAALASRGSSSNLSTEARGNFLTTSLSGLNTPEVGPSVSILTPTWSALCFLVIPQDPPPS